MSEERNEFEESIEGLTEEAVEEIIEELPKEKASTSEWGPLQKPEKNHNTIAMVVVMCMFVFVVGLCIFIAVNLSKAVRFADAKKDQEYKTEDGSDPWADIFGDKKKEETEKNQPNVSESKKEITDFQNHSRDEFTGDYYEEFVDSIDTNVPYMVFLNEDVYQDTENGLEIHSTYVQVEGDVPNLEKLNQSLQQASFAVRDSYQYGGRDQMRPFQDGQMQSLYVETYVTYNDEQILSICVKSDFDLRGMTVNLVTGTVLDNSQVLRLPDDFSKEFCARSRKQNGTVETLEYFSDDEIMAMLRSNDNIILFYTPIGLELGFNYRINGYRGWVTISMKDYENYMGGV